MRKLTNHLLLLSLLAGLAACTGYRDPLDLPSDIGAEAKLDLFDAERFSAAEPVQAWWDALQDPQLSELIERSLQQNKDIGIAFANLLETRGILSESGWNRFPAVTGSASYNRIRDSEELGEPLFDERSYSYYDAGFDAAWELDMFGRVGAQIGAAKARELSAQANLRNVYVSVAAEVARTYIELRGAQYRLEIAKSNMANQQKTLDLTRALQEAGRSSEFDVAQARVQLQLTGASIPALEAQVAANINRLSVLTGQLPNSLQTALAEAKPLPMAPAIVNVGDVSGLLRRRPDIKKAEADLQAAIADYNVSVAEQFPVVNIVGSIGFAETDMSDFGSSALTSSFGPSVQWAAFDMGRVRARIAQTDARAMAASAAYEKTVLEALEELQTAVSNLSKEEQRRRQLQLAALSSRDVASSAEARYRVGASTFLNVLTAEATDLTTQDTLAQSEINAALNLIAVYKALGGGWQSEQYAANNAVQHL